MVGGTILSTKAISLPVRPPIRPRALVIPCAAPLIAGPADDVTRESPSEALDFTDEADAEAFEAAEDAASVAFEAVELFRITCRERRGERRAARVVDNIVLDTES